MTKYLLDTNIVSEPLRPQPNPDVLGKLHAFQDDLAIPAVVWHELWFGCLRLPPSVRRTVIQDYLQQVVGVSMPILPYDDAAAVWHASERARLAMQGKMPPFVDGQIAAVAYVHKLVLVTFNLADFQFFGGIEIEDWRI